MADFAEYESYDGLGLAELVLARQLSAEELLDAAAARGGAAEYSHQMRFPP
jgi:amidase